MKFDTSPIVKCLGVLLISIVLAGLVFSSKIQLIYNLSTRYRLSTKDVEYKYQNAITNSTEKELNDLKAKVDDNSHPDDSADNLARLSEIYISEAKRTNNLDFYSKAEEIAEKSLKLQPLNKVAMLSVAKILMARHQFHEAISTIDKIPEKHKKSPEAIYLKAVSYIALGLFNEALEQSNLLSATEPSLSSATLKALIMSYLGQDDLAFYYFKRAIEIEDIKQKSL